MQTLSRDLAQVSTRVASASDGQEAVTPTSSDNHTITIDAPPTNPTAQQPSVPELLHLIDEAANEIHLSAGKMAEQYVSRRPQMYTKDNSLLGNSDFQDVVAGKEDPLVARQGMDEHYRALHDKLAEAARRGSGQADAQATTATIRQEAKLSKVTSSASPPPPPEIITTRPTLPSLPPARPGPLALQSPPPDHPILSHAPELSSTPGPGVPTPKHPQHHHHHALNFLNPFHHHIHPTMPISPPPPPLLSQDITPTPTPSPSASPTLTPAEPFSSTPQPIITHPNPYRHAPHTPLDLAYASWGNAEVMQRQKGMREALRGEREKVGREMAAAVAGMAGRGVEKMGEIASAGGSMTKMGDTGGMSVRKLGDAGAASAQSVRGLASQTSQSEREMRRKRSLGLGLRGLHLKRSEESVGKGEEKERRGWFG